MPSEKTGLFLSSISVPIVEKVMTDFGYTKKSNAINFIIQEYSRLTQEQPKQDTKFPEPVEEKVKQDLSSWFVSEDKNA